MKMHGSRKLLIALYVDDGLVAATDPDEATELVKKLKSEFKITVKPATYFLGIEIERKDGDSIKIHQQAYTKKILQRFGMDGCRPVATPIIKDGSDSGKADNENCYDHEFPYRQAVGSLMYLMVATRPDIAYAVGVISRSLENPTKEDVVKVKRIFRYIQGTMDYGIRYIHNHKPHLLESYSDADHGGDSQSERSTSGVICLYAGGAVTWLSQKQSSVAISTTEAEIVAASEAAREIIWLKRLLMEVTGLEFIPDLQVDNGAAIQLSQNPEQHRRTKHIKLRHFFVRELVTEGEITVKKVPTEFQLVDIMTKPIPKTRFLKCCQEMGLFS